MTLTPSTHASLLLRLRDPRDHEAWVEFVTLYEPTLYRLLRRHGLQDADARDVMQEFFVAVSRSIERWDPSKDRGSFRAWLRRVTRNLVINWLKRGNRRVDAVGGSGFQALLEMAPSADDPETGEFDREVRRARFRRAVELVREEVQPATWLAFWETGVLGVSNAEAAKKLNLSVGAVRVAKCRVFARIQYAVKELEETS